MPVTILSGKKLKMFADLPHTEPPFRQCLQCKKTMADNAKVCFDCCRNQGWSYSDVENRILKKKPLDNAWIEAKVEIRGPMNMNTSNNYENLEVARDALLCGNYEAVKKILNTDNDDNWHMTISVTGAEGYILTPRAARAEAFSYWHNYFDDWHTNFGDGRDVPYIEDLNRRCGTNIRSARSAARYVLQQDGEYHGLDVHAEIKRGRRNMVLVTTSCGCLHTEINRLLPDLKHLVECHDPFDKQGKLSDDTIAQAVAFCDANRTR